MDFQLGVEVLHPHLYLFLALLQVLDLFKQDVLEVLDVAGLARLANFEQFEVGESEGSEIGAKFLGSGFELFVEGGQLFLLLGELLHCDLHAICDLIIVYI